MTLSWGKILANDPLLVSHQYVGRIGRKTPPPCYGYCYSAVVPTQVAGPFLDYVLHIAPFPAAVITYCHGPGQWTAVTLTTRPLRAFNSEWLADMPCEVFAGDPTLLGYDNTQVLWPDWYARKILRFVYIYMSTKLLALIATPHSLRSARGCIGQD